MKNIISTLVLAATFGATTAYAGEIFADHSVTSAVPGVSTEAAGYLNICLTSDVGVASSKAIRACTKAYKASIPSHAVRSDLLTRRGLLYLSAGRFDKASNDFKSAARLNKDNEFANLSEGFAAVMQEDYTKAAAKFKDCTSNSRAAPLALYGLAVTKELSGDKLGAAAYYKEAADLRPDWKTPRAELERLATG